jgi:hypothetical protein
MVQGRYSDFNNMFSQRDLLQGQQAQFTNTQQTSYVLPWLQLASIAESKPRKIWIEPNKKDLQRFIKGCAWQGLVRK